MQGLATLNDIVEALVGEVEGSALPEEPADTQRTNGSCLIDGSMPLQDINEILQGEYFNNLNQQYHTLAGFLLKVFTRIPQAGDIYEAGEVRFEIVDMDKARIDKVLVVKVGRLGGVCNFKICKKDLLFSCTRFSIVATVIFSEGCPVIFAWLKKKNGGCSTASGCRCWYVWLRYDRQNQWGVTRDIID